jgi:light-regulated signal transduction histidine kinase (bacteriophytochrome)
LTTVWRWPPDTFCGAEIIRQFKQVASDRAGAERRIFVANDVVRDVIHLMDSQIRKSETRVVLDLQPDIELDSYPGIFGQVLQNLVENAPVHAFEIDAPGVIRIVMRDAATTDALVLTVADNGKGIPEEQRERIWDPFFTTRRGEGGTGLGLHIVQRLVTELLGGSIAQGSPKEGTGCEFVARSPSRRRRPPPRTEPALQIDRRHGIRSRPRADGTRAAANRFAGRGGSPSLHAFDRQGHLASIVAINFQASLANPYR